MSDFLDLGEHANWKAFVRHVASNNTWGDHLCLVAIANALNVEIRIISSVEAAKDEDAVATVAPFQQQPGMKSIVLSNWHEAHFNYCIPAK